jgi:hypothetical protein
MAPDTLVVIQGSSPGGLLDQLKSAAPSIGLLATFGTLAIGLWRYRRAQLWKRAEFVADEMMEFNADPQVCLAQTLIDWGLRRVNIFGQPELAPEDAPLITREVQWRALVPHKLKEKYSSLQTPRTEDSLGWFTVEEAKIRDIYDDFLFYLSRFHHFIESRLVRPHEIEPYLRYWVEEIASPVNEEGDAKWRCALIGFIWSYRYYGVVKLFAMLGHRIDRDGECWKSLSREIAGDPLLNDLRDVVGPRDDERLQPSRRRDEPRPRRVSGRRRRRRPLVFGTR